jgi:hypothetical protein
VTVTGGGTMLVLTTGNDGRTPEATLRPATTYQVSTRGLTCLADATSSLAVPAGATGLLPDHTLALSARPATGSRVLDVAGRGLAAQVRRLDNNADLTAANDGTFALNGTANTTVRLEVSLAGYLSETVAGRFNACGQLELPPVTLTTATASIAARVLRDNGQGVADAQVRLRVVGEAPTGPAVIAGDTDAQGRVTLALTQPSATPRPLIASVRCPGNLLSSETPVVTQAGQTATVELLCGDPLPPASSSPSSVGAPPPTEPDTTASPPAKGKSKGKGKAI